MTNFSRYAVYFSPPEADDLSKFSAGWFGWNAHNGKSVSYPILENLNYDLSDITKEQYRYGFHGTLKPPFLLVDTKNLNDLKFALVELSKSIKKFEIPSISLKVLDRFVAIVPTTESKELTILAKKCVEKLDDFRQVESAKKIQRRRSTGLSKSEEYNLTRWGYPHVMDNFQFHLTMSGRLKPAVLKNVIEVLNSELQGVLNKPLPIGEICLFGENASNGNFQIIQKFSLDD